MTNEIGLEALALFEAHNMVLSSYPPKKVDVLFMHARSHGDETGLFELASEMYHEERVDYIATPNNEGERIGSNIPYVANPGRTAIRRKLVALGVPDNKIENPDQTSYHTEQESSSFIALSKVREWRSSVSIAHPHQLLRIMLGTVKEMEQQNYWLEAYTAFSPFTPWQEEVHTNQGLAVETRFSNIKGELERIPRYQANGSLASLNELINYIRRRELGLLT